MRDEGDAGCGCGGRGRRVGDANRTLGAALTCA